MRVFRVQIVLTNVNDREFPERGEIHYFIDNSLAESSLTEEADGNLSRFEMLRGKRRSRGDAGAASNDRVGSEIAGFWIGNMHGAAFAFAVAGFFTEKFCEHAIWRSALCDAVSVSAMRAGDVIVGAKRFTNADGHGFLADVKMGEAGHQGTHVEFIDLFLKQANHLHAAIHAQNFFYRYPWLGTGCFRFDLHRFTPLMLASTSKTTAKSSSTRPMPRADVKNSLVMAVVGMGTSSARPSSRASSMSFCIMFTLNQASAGSFRTNGLRYFTMGDAMALLVRTSTATSREMPLFSASKMPSEKASI